MAFTSVLRYEKDLNNQRYLECLADGMDEWIDVKALTGNIKIFEHKQEIKKEIKASPSLIKNVLEKMKSIGIKKDTLIEFKKIFKRSY